MFQLTDSIKDFLLNAELEEISIGCSDSQIIKITKGENVYFLKWLD